MKTIFKSIVICALIIAAFTACNSSPSTVTGTLKEIPEVASWLKGTWKGDCTVTGAGVTETTDNMEIIVTDDGFQGLDSSYDNATVTYSSDKCIIKSSTSNTNAGVTLTVNYELVITKINDTKCSLSGSIKGTGSGITVEQTLSGTFNKQ